MQHRRLGEGDEFETLAAFTNLKVMRGCSQIIIASELADALTEDAVGRLAYRSGLGGGGGGGGIRSGIGGQSRGVIGG